MEETERIKFDVIGLRETKRRNPLSCTWKNGAGVFLGSRRENSTSGRIGFIVAPRLVQKIRQVSFPSHRIGVLDLQLDKKIKVSVIQIYAPTADKDEADHTDFYDEVRETAAKCRSYYEIISGDFNACVSPKRPYEAFIGPHSLEERNEAGERLASFCETSHFYHGNSRFQKAENRRWTYVSPNGVYKHELDILCNRKVFTDVAVVPSFQTGSDYRLLRAKFHFNNIKAMLDRMAHRIPPPTILDADAAERLAEMHDFGELDSIDEEYHELVTAITSIEDGCRKKKPNHITSRITEETRQLLEKRRNLKRTTHSHLEMTLLNRVCREKVAKVHEAFTRKRLMEAAESRTSIKLTARSIAEYRQVIPCLRDSEGRKVMSRLGMEAPIKEYYERLFHSPTTTAPSGLLTQRLEDTLPFTPSEVRHAVELMPSGKCSGEDKLVAEGVRACGHPLYVALAKRFTRYVEESRVPTAWKTSNTALLHKNGDKEDLGNYRPISPLPVLYNQES